MTTGTHASGPFAEKEGLVAGHSYTVISAHEVTHEGEKKTLLKIWNTWGKVEWQGDWSDKSELWTESLKEEVEFTEAEDGIFFMSVEDYLKCFESTALCYYEDTHSSIGIRTTGDETLTGYTSMFRVKIPKKSKNASFMLSQISDQFDHIV